tara:strand:+ start:461 stop:568 length:108 start_codon:yes stop_codon:yes gene_type:complete
MNLVGEHESSHPVLNLENVVVDGVDGCGENLGAVM